MQNTEDYNPIFIERTVKTSYGKWKAKYQCDCGNIFETFVQDVTRGKTRSCGCLRKITTSLNKTMHGMWHSPTYSSWYNMKTRCTNPNCKDWKRYGGRGIAYDPKWETFEGFLEDMGEKPGKGWDIDRIDNNGNYCKDNCQWITRSENIRKSHKERKVRNGKQ